jgi:hypothetical protein
VRQEQPNDWSAPSPASQPSSRGASRRTSPRSGQGSARLRRSSCQG